MIRRLLAVGSIVLTGVGLGVGGVVSLLAVSEPVAVGLAGLGIALGAALVAGGVYLYRSDVRTVHTARIAGWNLLGAVLLGLILVLAVAGAGVAIPLYVLVDVLGVSSVAHVLIGYNDVRRIRAEELARQRRTLAVVNRLTRHNLRNDTQVLTASASQLAATLDDPDHRATAERIRDGAMELATINEELQAIQTAIDADSPEGSIYLPDAVASALDDYRTDYPDGTFEADVPEVSVAADGQLETALDHLVENAVEHATTGDPFVRVTADVESDTVTVSVHDRGPGVPDEEVAVLTGEQAISQLQHASGLGLWVVKTIADTYGGDVAFDTTTEGGVVSLSLARAT
jgi:signal transduction histidine kinase